MDIEKRIAFIQSQIVCATAEIEGMKAENQYRRHRGETIAYDEDAFFSVPAKYGIEQNQVIDFLNDC